MKAAVLLLFGVLALGCVTQQEIKHMEKREDGALRLTNCFPKSCQNPVFSPDGKSLMFTRFLNGYNKGPSELVQISLATLEENVVVSAEGDNVNVPYGSWVDGKITWASDETSGADEVYVAKDDGADKRQVTNHYEDVAYIEPVFNLQNTNKIVFEIDAPGTHRLALVELDKGSRVTELTDGEFDDRLPSWSPDGKKILWQRNVAEDDWRIYVAEIVLEPKPRRENVVELTNGPDDTDNSWTHDGSILSSRTGDGSVANIFVLKEGKWKRITNSTREDGAPSASPDGSRVAFESHTGESDESPSEIWVIGKK